MVDPIATVQSILSVKHKNSQIPTDAFQYIPLLHFCFYYLGILARPFPSLHLSVPSSLHRLELTMWNVREIFRKFNLVPVTELCGVISVCHRGSFSYNWIRKCAGSIPLNRMTLSFASCWIAFPCYVCEVEITWTSNVFNPAFMLLLSLISLSAFFRRKLWREVQTFVWLI